MRRRPAQDDPRADRQEAAYRRFWQGVGEDFPDLGGAESTRYYLENEQLLLAENLPRLEGLRILKTDLWDEAKNTRILRWAATQGAEAWGIDISTPIVRRARAGFERRGQELRAIVSDVRALPFREGSFDAVYSMGTVEHFDESEAAVSEIFRVTRPSGRAIVGVPNRRDPFLRPLLVALLYRLGLYGYGFEKSYSRQALRRICEAAGFEVVAETGILFIPGWLRMLDLLLWVRARPLSRWSALAVRPFAWLYRRVPALRRHGYLIAAVGARPGSPTSSSRQAADPARKQSSPRRSARRRARAALEPR